MSTYGNLKYNFTFPASSNAGSLVLIKSITASASASVSFVNGSNDVVLDSTYKAYKFVFKNIHSSATGANALFQFQGSTNTGSSYGVNITSTAFFAYHDEADSITTLTYDVNDDLAQSTGYQNLSNRSHNDNDSNMSGEFWLFNPSSTTYVKHFMATTNNMHPQPMSLNERVAGYFNTTSAINAIDFKMSSGNIDDGTISLYGLA
jgi:hypothetical protein